MIESFNIQTVLSFAIFSVAIVLISYIVVRHSDKSDADYFVGSRSFGKFLVALSIGAAGNSGAVMIASVGFSYTQGISALIFPLAFFAGDLTFWTFFPQKVNQLSNERNCYTVPELLSSAVSSDGATLVRKLSGLLILLLIGIYGSAQFYAAGTAVDGVFHIGISGSILLSAAIIVSYSALGGVKSSIWIGVIHAVMMFGTAIGVLVAITYQAGGVERIISGLHNIDPQLLNPFAGFSTFSLVGYVLGFAFSGFGFGLSSPHLLVRMFSGKNPDEMKSAKWIYLSFLYSVWFATTLFGVVARVVMPDISDPEQAIPIFAASHFNPWIVGLVLAGIFSAIASTADATLLVFTSSIGLDIAPRYYDRMTEKYGTWYRFSVFIIATLIYLFVAIQLTRMFDAMIFVIAAIPATFGPVMLVVLLKWRTSSAALALAMLAGFAVSIVWTMAGLNGLMVPAFPGFIAGLVIHACVVHFSPSYARARN